MKRLLCALLLLLPLWVAGQRPWCPEPTNRLVNDYSGILSDEQRQELENRLVKFDNSTSNQILVVITPTLHDNEIMDLATRIGTTWGVGQKDLKNGVVILIKSKTEEEDWGDVALAPGYGLEGALPDAFCKHIIDDNMIEPLGNGDYYQAICKALDVIEPVCRGEYSYEQYKKDDRKLLFLSLGIAALVVLILFAIDRIYRKKHPGGKGGFGDSSGSTGGPTFFGGFPFGGFGGGFGSGGFGRGSGGGFGGFGGGSFGGGGAHGRF